MGRRDRDDEIRKDHVRGDDVLGVREGLEIRERHRKPFGKPEEPGASGFFGHVGNRVGRMARDEYSKRKEDRKHRRGEGRKKEHDGEGHEKLQVGKNRREEKELSERETFVEEQSGQNRGFGQIDYGEHERKTEEFSKHEIAAGYGLRKDEVDRPALDFAGEHLSSDENDRHEARNLDHREAEVENDAFDLSEREGRENDRKENGEDREKENEGQEPAANEFSKRVEGDIEHGA